MARTFVHILAAAVCLTLVTSDRASAQIAPDAVIDAALADVGNLYDAFTELEVLAKLAAQAQRRCDHKAWLSFRQQIIHMAVREIARATHAIAVLRPLLGEPGRFDWAREDAAPVRRLLDRLQDARWNLYYFQAYLAAFSARLFVPCVRTPSAQVQQLKKGAPGQARPKSLPPATVPGLVITSGLDGGQWCTYGGGTGFPTLATPTDDKGTPLLAGGPRINEPPSWPLPPITVTPEGEIIITTGLPTGPPFTFPPPSQTPIVATPSGAPSDPTSAPPGKVVTPPTAPPPETPVAGAPSSPEPPPEQVTIPPVANTPPVTNTPPGTPIIIFVKATQSVLEGQPQGTGLPGYNTAVFPAFKPELPFTAGESQTAQQDSGFDKDPVKCTTGQGGECKLELDASTLNDYGIGVNLEAGVTLNSRLGSNYRLDYSVPQTAGGVVETTGLNVIPDIQAGLPNRVNVAPEAFNIGDRSFLRLGFNQPFGLNYDLDNHYTKLFGDRPVIYIIDFCRDKQPGPPLGTQPVSFSLLNRALPEATLRLRLSIVDRLRGP
jgi:hypothetical protein